MSAYVKSPENIVYPSGDGEPVAETFVHLYALLTILEVLKQYLEGQQATVLANQFLYFIEGNPRARVAPDVMVIFGVAPGGRDHYKLWEEGGQVPAVIVEVTSKSTQEKDKAFKKMLYERLGVHEYWLFDPKGEWIAGQLQGYRLVPVEVDGEQEELYTPIVDGRIAPLGLRVAVDGQLLAFFREDTRAKLFLPSELHAELRRTAALLEQEYARAERERAERLAEYLRSQGIDPDSIA
ncbi:Uma2 family endonuclease [Gloeobacter morelensis]|uniref:Uma2 family endonuclease n=1 Tax=Gloeobacter morelensis MG652769 TaxID=2781736 RepID=A0ABY3PQ72_9CYAN|nr:Uma2 family endonuclease [Gloeobacter morelensis]UFP95757.1 Uma2 family endonuclease [Gloeobacter morelensis MG652769]